MTERLPLGPELLSVVSGWTRAKRRRTAAVATIAAYEWDEEIPAQVHAHWVEVSQELDEAEDRLFDLGNRLLGPQ